MSAKSCAEAHVMVVDVGGTHCRVGIVDTSGELLPDVLKFPTPGPLLYPGDSLDILQQRLLEKLLHGIQKLRNRYAHLHLKHLGVAFGAVITHDGLVENASVLWHQSAQGFNLLAALRQLLPDVWVCVVNDVSAAAWYYRDEKRFILVTVSTGVSNKVFDDRIATPYRLMLDADGRGGEIGHVVVDPFAVTQSLQEVRSLLSQELGRLRASSLWPSLSGQPENLTGSMLGHAAAQGDRLAREMLERVEIPYCECGNLADLCSYTSGPAVERLARQTALHHPVAYSTSQLGVLSHGDRDRIDSQMLAAACAQGDDFSMQVLSKSTFYLAWHLLQLCAALGLDKILIVGGFAHGVGEPYFACLRDHLEALAYNSGYFTGWTRARLRSLIRPGQGYDNAALTGVGRLILDQMTTFQVVCKPVRSDRVELARRPRPQIGAEQVMARIRYAGICSTDLQIYRGERDCEPGILGHECVADVVEVGQEVTGLRVGETIAINPNNPLDEYDKVGHTREGVFQELFVFNADMIDKGQIVPLPGNAPASFVLLELLACVLHAQDAVADDLMGRDVLIMGAGMTGLLHTILARYRGARRIFLANRSPGKLRLAESMGLVQRSETLLFDQHMISKINQRTTGRGVDVAVIALAGDGGLTATEHLLPCLADRAMVCLFGGFLRSFDLAIGDGQRVNCDWLRRYSQRVCVETPRRAKITLVGTRGSIRRDYEAARDLVQSGQLSLDPLITHHISLGALPNVLGELARQGTVHQTLAGRVVVDMDLAGDVVHNLTEKRTYAHGDTARQGVSL